MERRQPPIGVRGPHRLGTQQEAVDAVQHGVGHVRGLRTRGTRRIRHRVEDAGYERRLALTVGSADHLLLERCHLLDGKRQPQIAATDNDAVGDVKDSFEIFHARARLNLC